MTLTNDSDESVRVPSIFRFHLQDPAGRGSTSEYLSSVEDLEYDELAPGGSPVSGSVCFDDPGQSGEYVVLGEGLFGFSDTTRIGWVTER